MGRKKKNSDSGVKQQKKKNNNSDSGVKKNIFDSGVKQKKKKKKNDEVKEKKKKNDGVKCTGGISCHQCRHKHRPNEAIKCKVYGCRLSYGVSCLMRKYPEEDFRVRGWWTCPRCRGICNCTECLKLCSNCKKSIIQHQNGLEDLDVEKDAMINKEEELNATISSLKKKQVESNTIICKLEANVSSLKASLAHEESQNLVLERGQGSLREELQRIKDSNSSLLQQIQLQNETYKLATKHLEFLAVENDAMKKKEEDLNATISSLKAALANEESQNLKRLEDLSVNQTSVLQALAATNQKLKVSCDDEAFKQRTAACKVVERQVQELTSEFAKSKENMTLVAEADKLSRLEDFKRVEDELRICRSDLHAAEEANKQKVEKIRRLEEGLKQAESRAVAAESRAAAAESELSSLNNFLIKCEDAAKVVVDKVADVEVASRWL